MCDDCFNKKHFPDVKRKNARRETAEAHSAVEETCVLLKQLKNVESVALQRGVAVGTVYDYLSIEEKKGMKQVTSETMDAFPEIGRKSIRNRHSCYFQHAFFSKKPL